MGDPRRFTSHVIGPGHPWQKERIEEEKVLMNEYGLKNKGELWRASTRVKGFTAQAKKLIAATGTQADREKQQLFQRLQRLGLLPAGAKLDDVLNLTLKSVLDRRLQTLVYRKGFARSVKQARQFITHQHVMVDNKIVTAPSYLVPEAVTVSFVGASTLAKTDHPERVPIQKKASAARKQVDDRRRRGPGGQRGKRRSFR
ncbi:30S ribosomal protein S4 [Candidatus Woesearchaeota archaeon]|nr:30S ribosomal protein S4 [Candidatus Woesearchaeota archaeon]